MTDVAKNVARVRERIAEACARSGRDPAEVTLVGISKTFPAAIAREAVAAGVADMGENRVQELREKAGEIEGPVRWHLVGHLQSNKVKDAVRLCSVIQSIDSISLAERIGRIAEEEGRDLEVMIQVNIGREPQKSGVDPDDVESLARGIAAIRRLRLTGLMAIPPMGDKRETRGWFVATRELRDRLRESLDDDALPELSYGMTDDFEIAVEEGATVVRVGRAIFGERA